MPVSVHSPLKWNIDKVAQAERQLAELHLELATVEDGEDRVAIERCIRTVEAMMPVYRAFERFMESAESRRYIGSR